MNKDEPLWQSVSLAGVNPALLIAVSERPARNQSNRNNNSQLQCTPKVSSSHFKMDWMAKNDCWKTYLQRCWALSSYSRKVYESKQASVCPERRWALPSPPKQDQPLLWVTAPLNKTTWVSHSPPYSAPLWGEHQLFQPVFLVACSSMHPPDRSAHQ